MRARFIAEDLATVRVEYDNEESDIVLEEFDYDELGNPIRDHGEDVEWFQFLPKYMRSPFLDRGADIPATEGVCCGISALATDCLFCRAWYFYATVLLACLSGAVRAWNSQCR